jgi:putative transposase
LRLTIPNYRAVDKHGHTVDVLLTAHRDRKAALRFFKKAVGQHGLPEKIMIDKSGANAAAIEALKQETGEEIEMRHIKYLNRRTGPPSRRASGTADARFQIFLLGSNHLARHRTHAHDRKGQMVSDAGENLSAAEQFYSLATLNAPEGATGPRSDEINAKTGNFTLFLSGRHTVTGLLQI